MIIRQLEKTILSKLDTGKAIILLGPRQTGKTTLLTEIAETKSSQLLLLNCDDPIIREQLDNANTEQLKQIIGTKKLIFIDEAQRVKNIGLTLKIITDQIKSVQLLVSGSSSLELSNEISEPLTGRKWEYMLYPISWTELTDHIGYLQAQQQLEQRLIFGMYPEIITNLGNEKEILLQLTGSYLYKDLLSYKGIRNPDLIEKLLKAIALQLGNEVSYNELARLLQVDKNTVSHYLKLLEQAFIIFRLQPFARNLRNEINTNRKIYFFDNGIRNALIANYNPPNLRQDIGALWENFLISERMKLLNNRQTFFNRYFWRTSQQQEIDYIEERDGTLHAYELKWNPRQTIKFPKTFLNTYKNVELQGIHSKNFHDYLINI